MDRTVCLVIPARNAAQTIDRCLTAAATVLQQQQLTRIILVDDGSTDDTARIAADFPVTCMRSPPRGRSAARNLGWRASKEEIIWFIDADCIPRPDALARLLPHFDDPNVGGAGGSFTMPDTGSLLAHLIHEEIIERHRAMPERVNFVATGNAAYRRSVLEQVGGFDERFTRAQDAELSYRAREAGFELAFAADSRVEHFHDTRLWPYLRTQAQQGYWRLWLHLRHSSPAAGDSYSSIIDHVQPPLAMAVLASLPLVLFAPTRLIPPALAILLAAAPVPMTIRIVRRTGRVGHLWYAPMSFVRAFARGLGLTWGVLSGLIAGKAKGMNE